jgi:hypothetical protein
MFIGVGQLLYVVPLAYSTWKKQRKGFLKGLIIGASLTLMLNAACWSQFL